MMILSARNLRFSNRERKGEVVGRNEEDIKRIVADTNEAFLTASARNWLV